MKKSKKTKSKGELSKKQLYIGAAVGLILGLILGIIIAGTTVKTNPSLIQTYCDIDIQTLYEKPCTLTEECYGRLELCSVSLKKCMTTVDVDKADIRNIRIPSTQEECEVNGGIWKVETVIE